MPFTNTNAVPQVLGTSLGLFNGEYVWLVILSNLNYTLLSDEVFAELIAEAGERELKFVTQEMLTRYANIIQVVHTKKAT